MKWILAEDEPLDYHDDYYLGWYVPLIPNSHPSIQLVCFDNLGFSCPAANLARDKYKITHYALLPLPPAEE